MHSRTLFDGFLGDILGDDAPPDFYRMHSKGYRSVHKWPMPFFIRLRDPSRPVCSVTDLV